MRYLAISHWPWKTDSERLMGGGYKGQSFVVSKTVKEKAVLHISGWRPRSQAKEDENKENIRKVLELVEKIDDKFPLIRRSIEMMTVYLLNNKN